MDKKNIEKNVVAAVFNVESEGYQALSELRQTASGDSYLVSAAALFKKENGVCQCLDGFDTGADTTNDAAIGGLIGMVVGTLAGPIGMLLGLSYGTLVGMSADASDAVFGASMLEQIANKLDDGMVAIVALTGEESNEALDSKLAAYDAVIARFDAKAVAAEVEEAYKLQEEMAKQARTELRKEKSEAFWNDVKESIKQGSENFKSDMGFTKASIDEIRAERKAEKQEKREQREKEFEENSEILRQGFTK